MFAACSVAPTRSPVQSPTSPPVPEEYRRLYEELGAALTHFEASINQKRERRQGETVFAAELVFALGLLGGDESI